MQLSYTTCATTSCARIFDNGTVALTLVAGSRNAEKTLLKTHLAPAATGWTSLGRGSGFRAVAMTSLARTLSGYLDLLFGAGDGFLKSQSEVVAKILSASSTSTAVGPTKEFAKDIPEYILEACGEVESTGEGTIITEGSVAELVVLRALLWFR